MKFTITSITDKGVKAKEDNPYGKRPTTGGCVVSSIRHQNQARKDFEAQMETWQEAEANRKEYKIKPSELLRIPDGYVPRNGGLEFLIGDRIEGDIINNEIINVKLL